MLFDTTKRVLAAMEREQVEYAIFGAVALNLHGLPRAIEDLEVARVDFDGVEVTVVTAETLWRMKKDTVRLKDRGDAERLAIHFGFGEA